MKRMEDIDFEWVENARAGDAEAFRRIVDRHSRRLFQSAYRLTGNEQNAEDVVQETFLKAYRNLHRFDGRSQFSTWLYRIAVNCAMDLMRKESRRTARERAEDVSDLGTLATEHPPPDRLAASSETGRAVARVLGGLSPTERAAFVMRHFEGYSSVEIGQLLGIRGGAARNAVFRAVSKLREALAPMVEEGHEASHG